MVLNVFASLANYGAASEENYLTESLVFLVRLLLDRAPTDGLEFCNLLCASSGMALLVDSASVTIETQVSKGEGKPDIVIKSPEALAYIEVKHDSRLSIDQLEGYHGQLQQEDAARKQLVLLCRSRYAAVETTLRSDQFSRCYWYEIYNWLDAKSLEDNVCDFIASHFMSFLEDKRMSVNHVAKEFVQGIPSLLNLITMIQAATTAVLPGVKAHRRGGWNWAGLYLDLPEKYWVGVQYSINPLLVVFENNRGNEPIIYHRELDLEEAHFFALNKDEQFECIVSFLQNAIASSEELEQIDSQFDS